LIYCSPARWRGIWLRFLMEEPPVMGEAIQLALTASLRLGLTLTTD
jgi:hypothetical protein